MTIQLSPELEAALEAQAVSQGLTAETYLRELLERELAPPTKPTRPYKKSYGMLAQYGPAPTDEEMDQNRREMFKNFGESL